jgi:hypothetical protein
VSFSASVQGFARKTETALSDSIGAASEELFGEIIVNTPVKSGLARGNWQTTVGAPATGTLPIRSEAEALVEVAAATTYARGVDVSVHLRNNLPYIRRLEYGWSNQAPYGMVRRAVARFRRMVYWRKRGAK